MASLRDAHPTSPVSYTSALSLLRMSIPILLVLGNGPDNITTLNMASCPTGYRCLHPETTGIKHEDLFAPRMKLTQHQDSYDLA